jgi:hypothetical protein
VIGAPPPGRVHNCRKLTINVSAWPAASTSGPVLLDPEAMPSPARRAVCVVGEPSTSDVYILRSHREDPNDGPEGRYKRVLIRDHDRKFTCSFDELFQGAIRLVCRMQAIRAPTKLLERRSAKDRPREDPLWSDRPDHQRASELISPDWTRTG